MPVRKREGEGRKGQYKEGSAVVIDWKDKSESRMLKIGTGKGLEGKWKHAEIGRSDMNSKRKTNVRKTKAQE